MATRPPRRTSFHELSLYLAFLVAGVAVAVPMAACRSETAETSEAEAPPATTPPVEPLIEPAPDSLGLELDVPARIRLGERVPIEMSVENRTGRALDLYLRGRTITFDVVVAGPGGEVVWRRLENEIIPAILHLRTLAPGERLEVEAEWDQRTQQSRPVGPGNYTVRGLLLVEGEPLETSSVALRIER